MNPQRADSERLAAPQVPILLRRWVSWRWPGSCRLLTAGRCRSGRLPFRLRQWSGSGLGGLFHCGPALDLRLTNAFAPFCAHLLAHFRLLGNWSDNGRCLRRSARFALDCGCSCGTQKCLGLPEKSNLGIDLEKNGFRHGAVSTSPSRISDRPTGWHLTLAYGVIWCFALSPVISINPTERRPDGQECRET